MKKIFTLIALLTCFLGAKAEWVEDYKIDYSTLSDFPFYVMGYAPAIIDGVMVDNPIPYRKLWRETDDGYADVADQCTQVTVNGGTFYEQALESNPWRQYIIANDVPMELDGTYTIKALVRASETVNMNLQFGNWGKLLETPVTISASSDFQEVSWEVSGVTNSGPGFICVQPGTSEVKIEWKWLTVGHNQKAVRPVEWIENLENGDAEKSWADMGLADVKFNDQENNYKICAWGKEKDRNMNEDGGWDPFPCDIEEVDGSHVFVVHGQPATTEGDASAWDNQFWIQSPKSWKSGTQLKISFRYKASKNVTVATQVHKQNPSDYLIWHAIGDITFTEEWQTFEKTVTWESDMDGGWSVAFQLNQNDKDAINFYFDDISWQNMKLDEGYFVAGCNTIKGIEYDFDNAVEFTYDNDVSCYVATIGEKNAYVNQVMISTVRGNDAAFKGATLKPSGEITDDPDNFLEYTEASLAKLSLPGEGIWKIYLDDVYKSMAFQMLEGNKIDPIQIDPNPTHVVINALERDFTADEQEGGTGQAWDNQFWIVANRPFTVGEETIVQFKYKSTIPAKSTTQIHSTPGNYLHYAAIGDVNFTEEWQDFEYNFTIPTPQNQGDMQSIAFNLSEIKDANTYELKDFVWKTADGTESLIDQTGSKNFYVKILGGNPEVFDDGTGISTVVNTITVPTATYNLAGQRVSKDYKGIVVKNGRKVVVK